MYRKLILIVVVVAFVGLEINTAHGQLFRRLFNSQAATPYQPYGGYGGGYGGYQTYGGGYSGQGYQSPSECYQQQLLRQQYEQQLLEQQRYANGSQQRSAFDNNRNGNLGSLRDRVRQALDQLDLDSLAQQRPDQQLYYRVYDPRSNRATFVPVPPNAVAGSNAAGSQQATLNQQQLTERQRSGGSENQFDIARQSSAATTSSQLGSSDVPLTGPQSNDVQAASAQSPVTAAKPSVINAGAIEPIDPFSGSTGLNEPQPASAPRSRSILNPPASNESLPGSGEGASSVLNGPISEPAGIINGPAATEPPRVLNGSGGN